MSQTDCITVADSWNPDRVRGRHKHISTHSYDSKNWGKKRLNKQRVKNRRASLFDKRFTVYEHMFYEDRHSHFWPGGDLEEEALLIWYTYGKYKGLPAPY